jgi:hypothetical protein
MKIDLIDRNKYRKDLLQAYDDVSMEFDVLDKQQSISVIPIPKGATNGDMIKAVFGAKDKDENFVIQTVTVTMCGIRKTFSRDWWYAPYKKEVDE